MALRLFRTTGYSTLLMPGESRMPAHPVTLVLWGSLWLGVVCNVAIWRWIAGSVDARTALGSFLVIAGASGVLFSLLGWRRTLKATLTVALVAGALVAAGLWSQQLPIDTLWQGPSRILLPAWTSFMRWDVLALVALLAVLPIVWLWNHQVRRVPGPRQLQANITGSLLAALMFGAGLYLIH
jgi:glucan phosphoethanolaminetransferase (alkaline phosphatase superfamily)